jgi:SAM-dependent methyltransferase
MKVEEYERMFRAEETHWWYVGMRAISLALLGEPRQPAPRLLDAGCGTGNNLVHLKARSRPVGVDLSPEAVEFCKSRGVAVTRASLLALPFGDDSFDEVTSFDVLYHQWVTDDRAAIREMTRVLRPGGSLLLRVPALKALWGAHDEAVQSRHRYTRAEVIRLLADAGLEVQRATYANFFLLPLLAIRRTLDKMTARKGSDVEPVPAVIDLLFRGLLLVEARLIRSISLPLGASVFALARKPDLAGRPRP